MAMVPRELTTELADRLQNSCVVSCACVSWQMTVKRGQRSQCDVE